MLPATKPAEDIWIKEVKVRSYSVPTDYPEADGTYQWDKTTIVVVEIAAAGEGGLGYTYADSSVATLIHGVLANVVRGSNATDIPMLWHAMHGAIRNLGRPGICSMAISAMDVALWDLKARILKVPLTRLLGAARDGIAVYGSGGFTSYSDEQLRKQFSQWVDAGISMVKMKVGTEPDRDPHRVRAARQAIGDRTRLFVDANGAYRRKQALALAQAFCDLGVSWFEEPVSSDDLEGLHLIRNAGPAGMDIAAGEYGYDAFYFRRMLEAEAVDVLQADATRCGGITGFLHADALCLARSLPLSAHTAPSIHLHTCCAAQTACNLEYFHDHARIESMFFDGCVKPQNGVLHPDSERPGLGLEFRRADAERYANE